MAITRKTQECVNAIGKHPPIRWQSLENTDVLMLLVGFLSHWQSLEKHRCLNAIGKLPLIHWQSLEKQECLNAINKLPIINWKTLEKHRYLNAIDRLPHSVTITRKTHNMNVVES